MLQAIRDKSTGWISWIIIILITIPFALWGINEYFSDNVKLYAAQVGDKEISLSEYQQAYNRYREQMRRMFGNSFVPDPSTEAAMKQRILDGLVEHELLLQQAYEYGLRIGDAPLANRIHNIPVFKVDDQFSLEQYQQVLKNQGLSVGQFESQMRSDMVVDQLRAGIQKSALISEKMLIQILKLQQQQREISYFTLVVAPGNDAIAVTDEEVEKFYRDNQTNYLAPAKAKFDYVELTLAALEKPVAVTPEKLEAVYAEELKKGRFSVEEQRKASHILIQVASDADAAAVKVAEDKIKSLQEQATPTNFGELAKAHSEDAVSVQQGGDLGYFGKGFMAAEFESQVFAMAAETISQPVRSPFGFHLIYLTDIKPGHTKSLAEATPELEKMVRSQEAEQQFYDQAEQLATLAYENPDNLDDVAKTLGLEVKTTDWIADSGAAEGIFADKKIIKAGFAEDVLAGNNSEVIELNAGQAIVLRIKVHEAAKPRPLEQIRADVLQRIKTDKARAAIKSQADALLKRLKAGESLASLAAELKLEVKQLVLGRKDEAIDRMLREAAFRLPKPKPDVVQYASTVLASGDYALIALTQIMDAVVDNKKEDLTSLRTRLENETSQSELDSFILALRKKTKIVENNDSL